MNFESKYIKYKKKYLLLKGGSKRNSYLTHIIDKLYNNEYNTQSYLRKLSLTELYSFFSEIITYMGENNKKNIVIDSDLINLLTNVNEMLDLKIEKEKKKNKQKIKKNI